MSESYVGEVRAVGFNFAPVGWALCNGQIFSIAANPNLFSLIGTYYGGDGTSTFALPDLRGRVPVHQGTDAGQTYPIGQQYGVEEVTLTGNTYPAHTHTLSATQNVAAGGTGPLNNAVGSGQKIFGAGTPSLAMSGAMIGTSPGGNQPHNNLQPYLALNWIISLDGIYPTQS